MFRGMSSGRMSLLGGSGIVSSTTSLGLSLKLGLTALPLTVTEPALIMSCRKRRLRLLKRPCRYLSNLRSWIELPTRRVTGSPPVSGKSGALFCESHSGSIRVGGFGLPRLVRFLRRRACGGRLCWVVRLDCRRRGYSGHGCIRGLNRGVRLCRAGFGLRRCRLLWLFGGLISIAGRLLNLDRGRRVGIGVAGIVPAGRGGAALRHP